MFNLFDEQLDIIYAESSCVSKRRARLAILNHLFSLRIYFDLDKGFLSNQRNTSIRLCFALIEIQEDIDNKDRFVNVVTPDTSIIEKSQ